MEFSRDTMQLRLFIQRCVHDGRTFSRLDAYIRACPLQLREKSVWYVDWSVASISTVVPDIPGYVKTLKEFRDLAEIAKIILLLIFRFSINKIGEENRQIYIVLSVP